MKRRSVIVAVALLATFLAVCAATARSTSSKLVADSSLQSALVSIVLTLGMLFGVAVLVIVARTLFRARSKGEEEAQEAAEVSVWARVGTVVFVLAFLGLLVFLFTRGHQAHHAAGGLIGPTKLPVHKMIKNKPFPFNAAASSITAILAVLGVGLALFWRQIANLFRARFEFRHLTSLGGEEEGEEKRAFTAASPFFLHEKGAPLDPNAEPDPRRAVVLSYQCFDFLMARAGHGRDESETPFEYSSRIRRALGQLRDEGLEAARDLTYLFSAARYSTVPVTPDERSRAIGDLDVISRQLAGEP